MAQSNNHGKVSLVVYDFDQTITCDHLYHRLDGGQLDALARMSDKTLLEVFGGDIRVKRLNLHFQRVKSGATMAIVSYGYVSVIEKALERMGLNEYWNGCTIVGSDSPELTQVSGRKDKIIENLKKKYKLTSNQILFVDDDPTNIRQADVANCSRTLGITPRRGMTEEHMCDIEKQAGVWIAENNDHVDETTHSTKKFNPTTTSNNNKDKDNKIDNLETNHSKLKKENDNYNGNNNSNNKDDKHEKSNNGIVITSPRTVMEQSSLKNKYGASSSFTSAEESHENKMSETTSGELSSEKQGTARVDNTGGNRTDWSKYNVTVPKNLEKIWKEDSDDGRQESPVVHIKSDSLNSDEDDGPVLGLPPEIPSSTHS